MIDYFIALVSVITMIALIYDFFTNKISGENNPGGKVFKAAIYVLAAITLLNQVLKAIEKIIE